MSQWIVNVTDETFEEEIIERSKNAVVVFDFWAEWCGPCRALGPVLESLATEYDGKFILAKVDTGAAPQAAASFQVQSIPAVFAMRDGRVIDGFAGALPESQIREWLTRVLPSEADTLLVEAKAMAGSNPVEAESKLRAAVELDPKLVAAQIELASLLASSDKADEAVEIIQTLEARGFLEPEAERVKSALEIKRAGAESGGVDACRTAADADPENLSLQIDLAEALAAAGTHEEALELALSVVKNDFGEHRERARQVMVDIFRVLPADSELTQEFRRQLSMALF